MQLEELKRHLHKELGVQMEGMTVAKHLSGKGEWKILQQQPQNGAGRKGKKVGSSRVERALIWRLHCLLLL